MKIAWLIIALSLLTSGSALSAESKYIHKEEHASTVIVFVHGFLGDATSSWTSGNFYWPAMLTEDPTFAGVDVYVYDYPTGLNASLSIDELAEDMRIRLRGDGVSAHEHLIFISHSMGALVTRAFLLKYRELATKTAFLYLLSPPTTGSQLATIGSLISRSPQLSKMRPLQSPEYLADLQRDWLAAQFSFPTYCVYERKLTYGILVVDQSSAASLCTKALDPIDADHISIAKPDSTRSAQYQAFATYFKDSSERPLTAGQQSRLSFQYARLFGAIEIPLLMKYLPTPNFRRLPGGGVQYSIPKNKTKKNFEDLIRTQLVQFIEDLPFHDTRPLLTDMWTDVAGKEDAAINILWRASAAGRNERACFYMEPLVDGGSGATANLIGGHLPQNWEKSCPNIERSFDKQIGFSFLLIENNSQDTLTDMSLFYRENYSQNKVTKDFKETWRARDYNATIMEIPEKNSLDNLVSKFSMASVIEGNLETQPVGKLRISELKPGEKRLAILNIYFSNEHNLPAGYLYGIYQFENAEYSVNGIATKVSIRRPYLEEAARVAVPYGWFNQ